MPIKQGISGLLSSSFGTVRGSMPEVLVTTPPERPGYVYMLATCDGGKQKTYVGWTYDVTKRLEAHNSGRGAKATKGRRWALIHSEEHPSKSAAMSAEYFLKKDRSRRREIASNYP